MRLTPRGRAAAVLVALLWFSGFLFMSQLAATAAFVGAAILGIGALALRTPRVSVHRTLERDVVVEGDRIFSDVEISGTKGRRVRVLVREQAEEGLRLDEPELELWLEKGPKRLRFSLAAEAWGRRRLGPLALVFRDGLGLVERTVEATAAQTIHVRPRAPATGRFLPRSSAPQPALGAHVVSRPGESSDFFGLRDYQVGDSIRRINWKASGRSGKTIVNQVTRDSFARVLMFLDLREKEGVGGSRSAGIRSGRAAAALLLLHEKMKDHVSVIAVGKEPLLLSDAANARPDEILTAIGGRVFEGDGPMTVAVRTHIDRLRPRSPAYFVTSGALDGDLVEAIRLAVSLNARPLLVSPEPPSAQEVAVPEMATFRDTRSLVLQDVRRLGVPVVDWQRDRPLEVALLEN